MIFFKSPPSIIMIIYNLLLYIDHQDPSLSYIHPLYFARNLLYNYFSSKIYIPINYNIYFWRSPGAGHRELAFFRRTKSITRRVTGSRFSPGLYRVLEPERCTYTRCGGGVTGSSSFFSFFHQVPSRGHRERCLPGSGGWSSLQGAPRSSG